MCSSNFYESDVKCFHHRDSFNYFKDLTFDFGFLENDCNQCTHKAFMSPQHKSLIRKVLVYIETTQDFWHTREGLQIDSWDIYEEKNLFLVKVQYISK